MAHGDADMGKEDAMDVTISPPVTISTAKSKEAESKKGPCPQAGKSNLLTQMFRDRLLYSELAKLLMQQEFFTVCMSFGPWKRGEEVYRI